MQRDIAKKISKIIQLNNQGLNSESNQDEVYMYLDTLSHEEILELEAIVIIASQGREYYPPDFAPEQMLQEEMDKLSEYEKTPENKSMAMCYITGKSLVLSEYLASGASILGINLQVGI